MSMLAFEPKIVQYYLLFDSFLCTLHHQENQRVLYVSVTDIIHVI